MLKRTASAFAWFAAVWFAYEIAWSLTGVPRLAGPVFAFAIAAFIAVDPAHLFWPPAVRPEARSRSIAGAVSARP